MIDHTAATYTYNKTSLCVKWTISSFGLKHTDKIQTYIWNNIYPRIYLFLMLEPTRKHMFNSQLQLYQNEHAYKIKSDNQIMSA